MSSRPISDRVQQPPGLAATARGRLLPALDGRASVSLAVFWLMVTLLVTARLHSGV